MTGIAASIERLEAMVERRPGFGVGTASSVTTLTSGLRCTTTDGDWVTATDLPLALGGENGAPTPGALVRAALGSCMAMSYRLRAERHGVDLGRVRVTVETDSALAGMLLLGAADPPGFTTLRFHVEVDSSASPAEVEAIIDEGDRLSPVLDVLTRQTAVHRTLSIERTEG